MTYSYETIDVTVSRIDLSQDGTHDSEYVSSATFGWSTDGSKVVFESSPLPMDPSSSYNGSAWYMKDIGTGTVTPISTDESGDYLTTYVWAQNANHFLDEHSPFLSPSNEGYVFYTYEQLDTDTYDGAGDLFYKKFSDDSITHLTPNDTIDVATTTKTVDRVGNWLMSQSGDVLVYDMDAHSGINTGKPVYIQDLDTGSRTLINQYTDSGTGHEYYYGFGLNSTSGLGQYAKLSPDQEKIYFYTTEAHDTVDVNGNHDIYSFDVDTQDFELISVQDDGTKGNGHSTSMQFSADGTKLFFRSEASNFVSNDTNGVADIFVKNLSTGEISAVTFDEATGSMPNDYYNKILDQDFTISPDGTKVAYVYYSGSTGEGAIYVRDLSSTDFVQYEIDTSESYIDGNGYSLAFSPDGNKLTFLSTDALVSEDTNNQTDAYYIDLAFDYITGTAACETLTGTGADEIIRGMGHSDSIEGLGGDDIIYGGDGHDTLDGGNDENTVYGGEGHDSIIGGQHAEELRGMDGHDTIYGGGGNDTIYTGTEDDQSDTVYGGAGDDIIYVAGMGNDQIHMDNDDDILVIGGDNVRVTVFDFTDGTDLIDLTVFGSGLGMSNVSFYESELDGWTVKVIDGSNRADIHIDTLDLGTTPLTAADFIF
ncbi:MAG: hypothetical protein MRY32_10010 [Rickettsiales bacterium]|nr:hypothetical protein [Rickettsiales bacterium]